MIPPIPNALSYSTGSLSPILREFEDVFEEEDKSKTLLSKLSQAHSQQVPSHPLSERQCAPLGVQRTAAAYPSESPSGSPCPTSLAKMPNLPHDNNQEPFILSPADLQHPPYQFEASTVIISSRTFENMAQIIHKQAQHIAILEEQLLSQRQQYENLQAQHEFTQNELHATKRYGHQLMWHGETQKHTGKRQKRSQKGPAPA